MRIYLVGGAVRDMLLGRPVGDRDYVVVGGSEEALRRRIPGLKRVGRRVPVWVRQGEEYTLSPEPDIWADLARRDLTINALALDEEGHLLALPGAQEDLASRILRPVAWENILADPLRLLRGARFFAQLPDFQLHPCWRERAKEISPAAWAQVAAERVGHEIRKVCAAQKPGNFLRAMADWGFPSPWFALWERAQEIPAGPAPFHAESLAEHTARVMDGCAGQAVAVWMAFVHDTGKTATPSEHWPHHHGHERQGERLAWQWGEMLRLPRAWIQAGALACRWHMAARRYPELRPGTRVRLLTDLSRGDFLFPFVRLVASDSGVDVEGFLQEDAAQLAAVHLPEHLQNQGLRSAAALHALRCEALVRTRRFPSPDTNSASSP